MDVRTGAQMLGILKIEISADDLDSLFLFFLFHESFLQRFSQFLWKRRHDLCGQAHMPSVPGHNSWGCTQGTGSPLR